MVRVVQDERLRTDVGGLCLAASARTSCEWVARIQHSHLYVQAIKYGLVSLATPLAARDPR